MDTAHQWPHQDQNQIAPPSDPYNSSRSVEEKTVKPQKDQAPLNCPRCNSINTKFCYFNNYSLTQPRHFCKNCRRYWTAGGSLRNVPVGGGSRKNKHRPSVVASNNFVSKNDHHLSQFSFQNPNSFDTNNIQLNLNSSYNSSSCSTTSAMELLRNSTEFASRGLNSYMSASIQNPNMVMYASGFNFQEFNKQQAGGFSVNHDHGPGNGYNNREHNINGAVDRRFVFPFGELSKQISSRNESDQNKEDGNPSLDWNGMSGGGSW